MRVESFIGLRYLKSPRKPILISVITAIAILGVCIGTMALIVVMSVMGGFERDIKSKIIEFGAHIEILQKGGIPNYQALLTDISQIPGVEGFSPYIEGEVIIASDVQTEGVVLRGIDPATVDSVSRISPSLMEKDLKISDLITDPATPAIIIGREMAFMLKALPDFQEKVYLISPFGEIGPFGPEPKVKPFKLIGTFKSGYYEYDTKYAYLDLSIAQKFLGRPGLITGVEIAAKDLNHVDDLVHQLKKNLTDKYPDIKIFDWKRKNLKLFAALKLEKIVMFLVLALVMVVASFTIVGLLMMVITHKKGDIGVLKALGASPGRLRKIFIIYGLTIGVIGASLGIGLGLILCFLIKNLEFLKLPAQYYITNVPVTISYLDTIIVGAAAVLLTTLATIYPSHRASKLQPLEGIRR